MGDSEGLATVEDGKTDGHVFCIGHLPTAILQPRMRYESPQIDLGQCDW